MIQSCIRDLYDMILGKSQERGDNEFPIPKLAFYLTKLDQDSKKILFSEKYKEVFGKYQLATEGPDDTSFLLDSKPKPISSGGGSPVGEVNYSYFDGSRDPPVGRRKFFWD
jgi:hypothetical protein